MVFSRRAPAGWSVSRAASSFTFLALLPQLLLTTSGVLSEVVVTGNTHSVRRGRGEDSSSEDGQCPLAVDTSAATGATCVSSAELHPGNVITTLRAPLQANTIRSVVPVKIRYTAPGPMDVMSAFLASMQDRQGSSWKASPSQNGATAPVLATPFGGTFRAPVYHFVQSPDLTTVQLPFKLLLLRTLVAPSVYALEVPESQAVDSWFPGYKWSVLLCIDQTASLTDDRAPAVRHLGWRFTRITSKTVKYSPQAGEDAAGDARLEDVLYAVIVEHTSEEEPAGKVASGIPHASAIGIRHDYGESDVDRAVAHPDLAALEIAPRKPEAWMLAAYVAATKVMGKSVR
ncbi:unnamed protein product [Amoebophrya sp. A25]|nr:unnamed protein product [Amoebophrya sp. A25]|eukprot:GSA25T00000893001.1